MIKIGDIICTRGDALVVRGIGPTTDQMTCSPVDDETVFKTVFPREVLVHWGSGGDDCPSYSHRHFHPESEG